jgi:plastin-1
MRGIESKEDLMHNAKYVISVARKMGATVFIAWEDIVEVNKNMLVTFVCELMALDKGLHGKSRTLTLEDTKKSRK